MSEPFLKIPEPSLPEHNLLRDAGTLPRLTSGLRDRVVLNVHTQVRYGRWADYARVAGSVVAACLLVGLVWNYRWAAPDSPQPLPGHDAVQQDPPISPTYLSPGMSLDEKNANAESDAEGNPLPQGGPSIPRDSFPEMRELNQIIERLQNRQNALCGLLPYL